MSIADGLLPEFDHEMATTRKVLERAPADKGAWKPHEKSFALGDLSLHVAELVGWTCGTLAATEMDMNPPGGPSYTPPKYESRDATLKRFDENVAAARQALAKATDADFFTPWTLKNGGQALFTLPRVAVIRTWVLNHVIHHRAQLSVYLRLLDVPVPSIYGPSADEGGM